MSSISQIPPDRLEVVAHNVISKRPAFYFGPYIVAMLVDAVLFGVILQLYVKWHTWSRKEDRKVVRYLVWYLMFLGMVSSTFLVAWIFHLFVYGFAQYGPFLKLDWTTCWFVLNMAGRLPVSMGCEGLADIIVTATIAICLFKSKTGWTGTDQLITRLLLTILFLGLFVPLSTRPLTNFYACAPKVYTLCLMIILNSRQKLRRDLSVHQDYPLSNLSGSRDKTPTTSAIASLPYAGAASVNGPRPSTQIKVTTETVTHVHRNTLRPNFSINRSPSQTNGNPNPLEVDSEDAVDGETDKDSLEGRLNSSEVRLTKEGKQDV